MKHNVYLLEFKDNSVYVGQTTNINTRINNHRNVFGSSFVYSILDECESSQALLIERMWMQLFCTWGFKVRNGKPWANINLKQRLTAGTKRESKNIDISEYIVSERLIKLPRYNPTMHSIKEFRGFTRQIIGGWIKYLRHLENASQQQVAAHVGIEQSTLCKIESGKRNYSVVTLLFICDYLKVDFNSTLSIFINHK